MSMQSWRRQARLWLPCRDKEQRLENEEPKLGEAASEVSTVAGTPWTPALKLGGTRCYPRLGRCHLCQGEEVADPKRQ